jgi:hypothetical protein
MARPTFLYGCIERAQETRVPVQRSFDMIITALPFKGNLTLVSSTLTLYKILQMKLLRGGTYGMD